MWSASSERNEICLGDEFPPRRRNGTKLGHRDTIARHDEGLPGGNRVDHSSSAHSRCRTSRRFEEERATAERVTQMMSLNTEVLLSVSLATGKLNPHLGHGSARTFCSAAKS